MDIITIISAVLGSSVLSSGITFITTRKKYNTEIESMKVSNFNDIINVYKNSIDDFQKRLDSITERYENLEVKYTKLQDEMLTLRDENRVLRAQLTTLSKGNSDC